MAIGRRLSFKTRNGDAVVGWIESKSIRVSRPETKPLTTSSIPVVEAS